MNSNPQDYTLMGFNIPSNENSQSTSSDYWIQDGASYITKDTIATTEITHLMRGDIIKWNAPSPFTLSLVFAEEEITPTDAPANEEYSGFYQVTATTTTMPRVKLSTLPEWIDIRLSRNNTEDDWEVATHNTVDGVMVTFNRIDFCDIYRSDQPRANYIKIATRQIISYTDPTATCGQQYYYAIKLSLENSSTASYGVASTAI
ncbi:hypothetical protein [Candidatus Epulonipiscium viviparus]|uniref:hypothetical protein n=1 Tax=Candidatus Epulonipiscium viviparus TaxID=420336 RepID=UPI00016C0892|nr:hypothetical protein [Candidatus Epulopiscium viviparus]